VNGQIQVKENYDGFASIGIGFFDWHPFGHTLYFILYMNHRKTVPFKY